MGSTKVKTAKKALQKRIKSIAKLAAANVPEPQVIKLHHVSLGDLRSKYSHVHVPVDAQDSRMDTSTFTRYQASTQPLEFRGRDGGLLAYRHPSSNGALARTLHQSITDLPRRKKKVSHKGLERSKHVVVRHYHVDCKSSPQPYLSRDYRRDGVKAKRFIEQNQALWRRMGFVLGLKDQATFKEIQLFDTGFDRLCGVFAGCVINQGDVDAGSSVPHRDPGESRESYACLASTGQYTGGGVILHDLHVIVELNPGDILMFPDSIIYHSNEPVQGQRNSVVCYTSKSMIDYWRRRFGMKKRKAPKKKSPSRVELD